MRRPNIVEFQGVRYFYSESDKWYAYDIRQYYENYLDNGYIKRNWRGDYFLFLRSEIWIDFTPNRVSPGIYGEAFTAKPNIPESRYRKLTPQEIASIKRLY